MRAASAQMLTVKASHLISMLSDSRRCLQLPHRHFILLSHVILSMKLALAG